MEDLKLHNASLLEYNTELVNRLQAGDLQAFVTLQNQTKSPVNYFEEEPEYGPAHTDVELYKHLQTMYGSDYVGDEYTDPYEAAMFEQVKYFTEGED